MPRCLNTPTKQAKKARQLVEECLGTRGGVKTKRAKGPPGQGMYSRTMIVELENGDEVVVQYRLEPLDLTAFITARNVLGSFVPEIEMLNDVELEAEGVWSYRMTRMPGQPWFFARVGRTSESLIKANRSLGRILSKSQVEGNVGNVIDGKLHPHLELIVASSGNAEISHFSGVAEELLQELDTLRALPLFLAHFDLNDRNILVSDDGEVTALIDWELSSPLPFGMGFHRVHTLAGEYSEGEFYMPPAFEEAERGFWQEIYDGVDPTIRALIDATPGIVQTAVKLGTLCNALQLQDGNLTTFNPVVLKAL